MPSRKLWITGASVLRSTLAFLLGSQTTYEWRDEPPPGSSIVRLESGLQWRWRHFMPVDADVVSDAPRMSTDELLRRHGGQQPGGACPNLFRADGA